MQPVGAHDHGHSHRGLRRVCPLRLGNQISLRDAAALQVVDPHSAFAEAGIGSRASRGDQNWRNSPLKKFKRMIQSRTQHWRRMPRILCRAKNYDCIGGMNFLQSAFMHNPNRSPPQERKQPK